MHLVFGGLLSCRRGDQAEHALDNQQHAEDDEEPVGGGKGLHDHQDADDDRADDVEKGQGTLARAVEETEHRPDQQNDAEYEDRVFRDDGGENDREHADRGFEDPLHEPTVHHIEHALHDQEHAESVDVPDGDRRLEDQEQNAEQNVDQGVNQSVGDEFGFFACHGKDFLSKRFSVFL